VLYRNEEPIEGRGQIKPNFRMKGVQQIGRPANSLRATSPMRIMTISKLNLEYDCF
jgi:hypothetical protein